MFKELFDLSRLVVGRTKFKGQKDSLPLYLGFEVDDNSVHKIMFIISTNSYEARFLYKVIEDKTTTSAQVLSIPRGLDQLMTTKLKSLKVRLLLCLFVLSQVYSFSISFPQAWLCSDVIPVLSTRLPWSGEFANEMSRDGFVSLTQGHSSSMHV